VIEEASEGKDRNVLVPILFETVLPPLGFRAIQAASLIDWRPGQRSAAFEGLLGAIRRIVGGQAAQERDLLSPMKPHSEAAEPSRRQSRRLVSSDGLGDSRRALRHRRWRRRHARLVVDPARAAKSDSFVVDASSVKASS
jgi:hypothetical protein